MSFVRSKKIKGNRYYYLVRNRRVNGKVVQKVLAYYGTRSPTRSSRVMPKRLAAKKRGLAAKKKGK